MDTQTPPPARPCAVWRRTNPTNHQPSSHTHAHTYTNSHRLTHTHTHTRASARARTRVVRSPGGGVVGVCGGGEQLFGGGAQQRVCSSALPSRTCTHRASVEDILCRCAILVHRWAASAAVWVFGQKGRIFAHTHRHTHRNAAAAAHGFDAIDGKKSTQVRTQS